MGDRLVSPGFGEQLGIAPSRDMCLSKGWCFSNNKPCSDLRPRWAEVSRKALSGHQALRFLWPWCKGLALPSVASHRAEGLQG